MLKEQFRKESSLALNYRTFGVRAASIDLEGRSIEGVISTEQPVEMFDWDRWEYVPEVLMTKGAEYAPQVPFLDAHARGSISDQLGSARNIRKESGELVGRFFFSSTAESEWTKVREGHVTDISAGYQNLEVVHVPRGQKQKVAGREFEGPVNVVTKWRLKEASMVSIGADDQAKLRGFDPAKLSPPKTRKEFDMNPQLRALLVSRGMDDKLTDDEAQAWLLANQQRLFAAEKEPEKKTEPSRTAEPLTADAIADIVARAVAKADEEKAKVRAAFVAQVDDLCEFAEMPQLRSECLALGTVDEVRKLIKDKKAAARSNLGGVPSVRIVGEGRDLFRKEIGTALTLRALSNTNGKKETLETVFPAAERGKDADRWKHCSLLDVAGECLRADGIETRGLTRENLAIAALGYPQQAGVRTGEGGYHVTASFPLLLQDAINKSMMVGYTEAPSTWRGPMRQAASVSDFKQINRYRMGAIPNLPIWNTNLPPEQASFADARERYAVEAYSLTISFNYVCLVNDDMDVISRSPSQMGDAAARTVNTAAWSVVTANGDMSDGQALFLETPAGNRKRKNLTTGAGAPSVANLQVLANLMRLMRGENTPEGNESPDILNLSPAYIVGPSALDTTIKQLVLSAYDPAASTFMVYNTATQLLPVIEPLLDANSTTAWYVFSSPARIDTVEVTFLQGQETPVTRNWTDDKTLAQNYAILQTFAAKAMNHRGIQKHAGA